MRILRYRFGERPLVVRNERADLVVVHGLVLYPGKHELQDLLATRRAFEPEVKERLRSGTTGVLRASFFACVRVHVWIDDLESETFALIVLRRGDGILHG